MMPWDQIGRPDSSSQYTVRLADPGHPHNFYWGKDAKGSLVFRFFGSFNKAIFLRLPSMQGVLVTGDVLGDKSHLTLELEDSENKDIFYLLCKSLMEATRNIPQDHDQTAVEVLMAHLLRWQDVLRSRKEARGLSSEQQLGLFAELFILDSFLDRLDPAAAVSCWTGPLGDEQDFSYRQSLLEVKATRASRDKKLRISSVDQLEAEDGRLTLALVLLATSDSSDSEASTLNGIVTRTKERLKKDRYALELFEIRLALVGYEDLADYDVTYYTLESSRFYAVDDGFPRIRPQDVTEGITDVRYSILTEQCRPWLLLEQEAFKRIFENE